jgi:hypothetical protein
MIGKEVASEVRELLLSRGVQQLEGEDLADFVARGLGITAKQAKAFLGALNDGNSIEDAQLIAGIESNIPAASLLVEIGRTIGAALGKLAAKL